MLHFLSLLVSNESWDHLGCEESYSCSLCGLRNKGRISRPHFKEPLKWYSLCRDTVTVFECSLRMM